MGRQLSYRKGSFYRVSDRTGFPVRAEDTRKEWSGLIVEASTYEPRQPQDLVRGVRDDQSVRDARPVAPATFTGPVWTVTTAAIAIGAVNIPVESLATFSPGQTISIMLDDGALFSATVTGLTGAPSLTITPGLPNTASDGAQVWNLT